MCPRFDAGRQRRKLVRLCLYNARPADLDKPVAAAQKRSEFDFYLRLTWEFGGFNTRVL